MRTSLRFSVVLLVLLAATSAAAKTPSVAELKDLLKATGAVDTQLFNVAPLGNPWSLDKQTKKPVFEKGKAFLKTKKATLAKGVSGALIEFEYQRTVGKKKRALPALAAPILTPIQKADNCRIAAHIRIPAQATPVRINWGEVAFVVDGIAVRAVPSFVGQMAQGLALAPSVAPAGAGLEETVFMQEKGNLCDELLLGANTKTIEVAVPVHLADTVSTLRLTETYTAVQLDEKQALQWQLLLGRHPPRPQYATKPTVLEKFPELERTEAPLYPPRTLAIGGESWFPYAVVIGAIAPVFGFGLGSATVAAAFWLLSPTISSAPPQIAVAIPVGLLLGGVPGILATAPIFAFAALVDFFFWYDARPEMRATDEDIKRYNVAHAAYMVKRKAAKERYNRAKKEYRDTEKIWTAELEGRAFWAVFDPVMKKHGLEAETPVPATN